MSLRDVSLSGAVSGLDCSWLRRESHGQRPLTRLFPADTVWPAAHFAAVSLLRGHLPGPRVWLYICSGPQTCRKAIREFKRG